MFFGYSFLEYGKFYIPVSTIEKTLIDFFYLGIRLQDDIISNIIEKTDKRVLLDYFRNIPESLAKRIAESVNLTHDMFI